MRITSKISHYHKGVLALVLAPFLWLQMYFHALQNWLIEILYNELFRLNKIPYSQMTHFLAFVCFSDFSLLIVNVMKKTVFTQIKFVMLLREFRGQYTSCVSINLQTRHEKYLSSRNLL